MGKKQHQKDKLYITATEWREDWGGKKKTAEMTARAHFRRLPFNSCSLTLQPFESPFCSKEGAIFDLLSIIPFLKKYGINPLTGEPMVAKDLIKLNFCKNSDGKYHCPVLYKVFNENSHIVAIKTTGNVFSYEAIEQLNINPKHWKDLLTDETFTRNDIIHIQDPSNLKKFNMADFYYIKNGLNADKERAEERSQAAKLHLKNLNPEATETLKTLHRDYVNPATESEEVAKLYDQPTSSKSTQSGKHNAALFSTGRAAASFTCTVAERVTTVEAAVLDDDSIRYKYLPKDKKAYVRLVTNLGPLNLELHCDLVPKTCDNFIRHCKSGYYKGCKFLNIIRNFHAQTGDPTNTGNGGESAFKGGAAFEDEFVPQLVHNARGIVSMASDGRKNRNKSQFIITLAANTFFDRRNTVFGKLVGGMDTLNKIECAELIEGDVPKKPIIIEDTIVFVDPFVEADEAVRKAKLEEEKAAIPVELSKPKPKKPEKTLASETSSSVGKYINMSQVRAHLSSDASLAKKPRVGDS